MAGRVVFARARSVLTRTWTFAVSVDGGQVGSLRGSRLLELSLPAGRHVASTRVKGSGSRDLEFDVEPGGMVRIAVDASPVVGPGQWLSGQALQLRVTDGQRERGVTLADMRTPAGNGRSSRDSALYAAGIALLLVGLVLSAAVSRGAGAVAGLVGAAIVIMLFFRRYAYRDRD
jgi:hypothetical protein